MKYIGILLVCIFGLFGAVKAQTGTFTTLRVNQWLQMKNTRVTDINTSLGADTQSLSKMAVIKAYVDWTNGRLAELYNYINTVDEIPTNGSFYTVGGVMMVNEAYLHVTTQNYTITLDYVNLEYTYSGGGGTFTLPALSLLNDGRVFYIYNKTAGVINFNNAVWTDNATSTTTLAAGKWCKYYVDNVAGKIRALGGN